MINDDFKEDSTGRVYRTDARLTKDYTGMTHCVNKINGVVSGEKMLVEDRYTDEDRKKRVEDNVAHLKLLKAKTDWKGNEDWSTIDKAITDGEAYLGG